MILTQSHNQTTFAVGIRHIICPITYTECEKLFRILTNYHESDEPRSRKSNGSFQTFA